MVEVLTIYAAASALISLFGAGVGYLFIDESFTGVATGIILVKIIEIVAANLILGLLIS